MAFNSAKYKMVKNTAKTSGVACDLETFVYANQKLINNFKYLKYVSIFFIVLATIMLLTVILIPVGILFLPMGIFGYIYTNKQIKEHLSFIEYATNQDPDFR
ncbi:hypothetical protein [Moraxella marmotae]|uniref:hypothetical protein n=1 Tax=Moraxella marmotae TaxID=3344520 RepID=UPI0035F2853D